MSSNKMDMIAKFFSWTGRFESEQEADEYLSEEGYDLKEVEKEGVELIKSILTETRLKKAENRKQLMFRAQSIVDEIRKDTKIENPVKSLLANSPNFQYQHSKLENISEDDALSMLDDQELLKVIEELEKENNNG